MRSAAFLLCYILLCADSKRKLQDIVCAGLDMETERLRGFELGQLGMIDDYYR